MAGSRVVWLRATVALLALAVSASSAEVCQEERIPNWDPLDCADVKAEEFGFRSKSAQSAYKSCVCTSCGGKLFELQKSNRRGPLLGCEFASEHEDTLSATLPIDQRFLGINPFEQLVKGCLRMLGAKPEYMEEANLFVEERESIPIVERPVDDGLVDHSVDLANEFAAAAVSEKDPQEGTVAIRDDETVDVVLGSGVIKRAWEQKFPNLWSYYTRILDQFEFSGGGDILPDEEVLVSDEDMANEAHALMYALGYTGDSPHVPVMKLSLATASEIFTRKGPAPLSVTYDMPQMEPMKVPDVGAPVKIEDSDEDVPRRDTSKKKRRFDNDLNNRDEQIMDAKELHTIWILNAKAYTEANSHIPKKYRVRREDDDDYEKDAKFAPGMWMRPEFNPHPLELVGDHSANTLGFAQQALAYARAHVWRDISSKVVYVTFRGSENLLGPLSHLVFNIVSQSFRNSIKDMTSVVKAAIVGAENAFHRVYMHKKLVPCPGRMSDFGCHEGAVQYWDLLRDHVMNDLRNIMRKQGSISRVIFNGYSMGGMLAQLAAADMASHLPSLNIPVDSITIGSPRVGGLDFTRESERSLSRMIRLALKHDPVPSFPWGPEYSNMGPMVILTRKGSLDMFVHPDGNGDGIQGYGLKGEPGYLSGGINFLYSHTPWFIGPAIKKFATSMVEGDTEIFRNVPTALDFTRDCPECKEGQLKMTRAVSASDEDSILHAYDNGVLADDTNEPELRTAEAYDISPEDLEILSPNRMKIDVLHGDNDDSSSEEFFTPISVTDGDLNAFSFHSDSLSDGEGSTGSPHLRGVGANEAEISDESDQEEKFFDALEEFPEE